MVEAAVSDPQDAELIIKKETVAVEMATTRGEVLRGAVFLRPMGDEDRGERLLDVLAQRWFVPLKTAERVVFVATRHLAWVRLDLLAAIDELDAEAEDDEFSSVARVLVTMEDGTRVEGSVRYSLPAPMKRLGDYLEKLESFFPLRTDDHVYLLSSTCILTVVPLEERR
ncbi:MAG: hypothetical protein A2138_01200 [Deltaproteobacteria bacterium RBG_16_71_12]|nr:MAG: hypothetical protein A2138_01200 [Deltaproteobacteria bacterium RBG_16_71_12]